MIELENSIKLVVEDLPLKKPCCEFEILRRITGVSLRQTIFSKTFMIAQDIAFLENQNNKRFFPDTGEIYRRRRQVEQKGQGVLTAKASFFNINGEIPSGPGPFCSSRSKMSSMISDSLN
jgi:hypothetical protein